ncbi:MAG TPA: response regulator [Geobacteraceae bacterium]|nr:response regulator [Geobacteraceae bacterium]
MTKASEKSTILVVDDEKLNLDLISILLRNRGFRALVASSAMEALSIIETESPELAIVDYMMPGMDGFSALKEIKRRFPDTYVIMFTGKGSEEIAVELMKAGASDYILKPFVNKDLIERVQKVLQIRRVELKNRELLCEREKLLREIEGWNRELEARVQEKTIELKRAQAEIIQTEKLSTLGFFSAGMAHEIRNPLNSISLFIQLIRSGLEDPEKLDYTEKIMKEISRIDGILRKLLDAVKRPKFEIKEVLIDKIIDETLGLFKSRIDMHKISVMRDYKGIPPAIDADPLEIEQIFSNLFVNSIEEMHDGGTLTVSLDHNEKEIFIKVSDTGKGIPQENLNKIFDPFYTTKKIGTGLGLSVVLRIVKTYHGRIEAENNPEKGVTFSITLPLTGQPPQ